MSRTSGSRRQQLPARERARNGASPGLALCLSEEWTTADLPRALAARAALLFEFCCVLILLHLPPTHPSFFTRRPGAGRGQYPLGFCPGEMAFRHRLLGGGFPNWVTSSQTRGLMTSTHNPGFSRAQPKTPPAIFPSASHNACITIVGC